MACEHCKRTSKGEERREQLLAAAQKCFESNGFHGASMSQLSKEVGMSPGHIYNYFESKDAIIEAIVDRELERILGNIKRLESAEGDITDELLDHLNESVEQGLNSSHSALMLEVAAEAARNPKVAAKVHAADAKVRAKMRAALLASRKGETFAARGDLDSRIEILAALFDGIRARGLRHPELDKDALMPVYKDIIRTLLGG